MVVAWGVTLLSLAGLLAGPPADGLLGCWPLDEGRGATVRDESPAAAAGTLVKAGWAGPALEFAAPAGQVEVPSDPRYNVTRAFTVSAWVFPERVSGHRAIVSKGRMDLPHAWTAALVDGKPALALHTARQARYEAAGSIALAPRRWAHVTMTYDAEAGARFYLDGAPAGEGPAAGEVQYRREVFAHDHHPLTFGSLAAYHDWQYEGLLRNVRLYGRALAPDEVAALHASEQAVAAVPAETARMRLAKTLTARLEGVVVGAAGQPVPARVTVRGADGRAYGPDKLFYGPGHFYTVDGRFSLAVPPGPLTVTACRGFEYRAASVTVAAGTPVRLAPGRWLNPPARGWYGGEHHHHYRTHGQLTADGTPTWAEAVAVARAEGLNYVSYKETVRNPPVALPGFLAREDWFEGRSHRNMGGHIAWLGASEQPNGETFAFLEARRLNALAIPTPGEQAGPADLADPTKVLVRDTVVAVPLGGLPVWDVVRTFSTGDDPTLTWSLAAWYHFLNCGYRLAGSGFTDGDLNLVGDQGGTPPGTCRTYLKLPELSWEAILAGYRAGRVMASNGPFVTLTVDGHDPGDVVTLPKASAVTVALEAHAATALERVELVWNGEVVKTFEPHAPDLQATLTLPVPRTGWLAARCVAKPAPGIGPYAHVSPVYVQVADQPMVPAQADIAFCLNWIAAYRQVLAQPERLTPWFTNVDQLPEVAAYLDRAEAAYRGLAARPRRWGEAG